MKRMRGNHKSRPSPQYQLLKIKTHFLRNELDRNQFLLGDDNEWIIPDLFKVFYFEYLFSAAFSKASAREHSPTEQ